MVALAVALLAGCNVELQNRQPAQELAQLARPPGSVYTGWRVFQDRCAGCHGLDATGTAGGGPDLLPRVRTIGPRQFVNLVLTRYDWQLTRPPAGALVDEVMQRRPNARPTGLRCGRCRPIWQARSGRARCRTAAN